MVESLSLLGLAGQGLLFGRLERSVGVVGDF